MDKMEENTTQIHIDGHKNELKEKRSSVTNMGII